MNYEWDFSILTEYRGLMLGAAAVTFQLVLFSVGLGSWSA